MRISSFFQTRFLLSSSRLQKLSLISGFSYFIYLSYVRLFLSKFYFFMHSFSKNILSSCTYGTLLITNFQGEDILINSIIQLFPEALINPTNVEDLRQTHHIITVESQIIAIPFSSLSHVTCTGVL